MSDKLNISISKEDFEKVKSFIELDERQVRGLYGFFAENIGYGGQQAVARLFGVSVNTVKAGREEFTACGSKKDTNRGRIRRPGGGRHRVEVNQPGLKKEIIKIVENNSYGNPQKVLLWTTLSLRDISEELSKRGFQISHTVVGRILEELGFSKQSNQKMLQVGEPHPDRDEQFKVIENTVNEFLAAGDPVISVDCKKKENLGNFTNKGQEYRYKEDARKTIDHDFLIAELGKVAPYGIYVLNDNTGFVNLTQCSDTSEFAVESIRWWLLNIGKFNFPDAKRILITCDGGGSNGCRVHLWKEQLAVLAKECGIEIHVCHFPPGTSKWNKVEHRLFSYITRNWAGKPLVDIQTVINYIDNTTTKSGLIVDCRLDPRVYKTGIKVDDARYNDIDIIPYNKCGQWNYTIRGFKSS